MVTGSYFILLALLLGGTRLLSGSWRKTVLLPWVVLTAPMLCGAGLANLGLVPALIAPWSDSTHTLVLSGSAALFAGSFTLQRVRGRLDLAALGVHWDEPTLVKVLVCLTGVALLTNAAQFLMAGQVPMLSADPDQARMLASQNGYLHIFSVLSGHLIPIAALILFTGNALGRGTRRTLKAVIAVNFLVLLLWVARGMLIYPIVTVIAMNFLLDSASFNLRKLATVTLLFLFIVSGVKYLRDVTRFGFDYNASGQQSAASGLERGLLANASVLYLTIALNYEIVNRYLATVPLLAPHSGGRIMAGNLLAYLPGTGTPYSELQFQNAILKKNEQDYTLTSTFFGVPYLDFGLPGVLIISFLVGLVYRTAWLRVLDRGTPWGVFFYAYLVSMATFIPYAFMYTQVSFTWFLLSCYPIIFLCSCRMEGASLWRRRGAARVLRAGAV
jgi:oligosaccharide repeat unit polymerase